MAKVSAVNKNDKRIKLSDKLYKKRQSLKKSFRLGQDVPQFSHNSLV